ncbi:MAG: EAL domain-containing protein [Porcipelethomonas sp.]
MKNLGMIYSTDQKFEEFITANELSPDTEYLIRIHTCIHEADEIMSFVEKIKSFLPASKIVGSSTSGVIFNGKIMTDCCMVSVTEFKSASLRTFITDLSDESGEELTGNALSDIVAGNIGQGKSGIALLFLSRQFLKINDLVEGINKKVPAVRMLGGIANTPLVPLMDTTDVQSFVFNENSVSKNAVVCAFADSGNISVYGDIIYVTEPVGSVHTITDAEGMIIRTVDGENAVEWYRKLLGVDFSNNEENKNTTIMFPLVKAESNIPWAISYSSQSGNDIVFPDEPDPVMFVPSEAKAGDRIRISYSSVQKTIEVCETVCENIASRPSEVLFGYSCVSRQDMFENCASWELLPFEKTNLCGALVAGEIGNIDNVNRYCNYSFAILSLAEGNSVMKLNIEALNENSGELVNSQEAIVNYLLKITEGHQSEKSQQQIDIENTLFIDDETGLWNITKLMFDSSLGKLDKMCMITVRNESLLKAFLSKSKFTIYFNRFHRTIREFIGKENYSYYIYKETSLIVTANSEISDDEFTEKMRELQNKIAEFRFSSYVAVSEFALVMHEENMIKKAELTLVRMRNKKNCFLTYTPDLGLEKFNAQKMKMIMILNHAVSNDGVVPYFQGIRNNKTGEMNIYEALMRIEDSEGNIYTPYHFMDIAKEYGYYSDISYIMINKVLEIFKNREEKVTINMTVGDVYNYKIVHSVLKFLESAPHPQNYIFELTETEEIEDYQIIFEFVEKVHGAGGKIAIDDFGSGFSNIVHVFKIPSDYIKIDGEIIKNICSDIYAQEFLEMISCWADKHKKEIIAEFVENEDIQNVININNIRYSQGYLYSKPARLFGA